MADLSDVQRAVVDLLAATAYPAGTAQPSAIIDPATGAPVTFQASRGWPQPAQLQDLLRAGSVYVNVWALKGGQSTTRYPVRWQTVAVTPPTVTLAVSGNTVTLGGAIATGQNVAIVVDGVGSVHAVQAGDTLAGIASGLAMAIGGGATSSGPVITIPGTPTIGATVGTFGQSLQEVARQIRRLQVNIWAPTPGIRDAAAKALVPALRSVTRLALPDGSGARLITECDGDDDDADQKEQAYRRILIVPVEYATTVTGSAATVAVVTTTLSPSPEGCPVTRFDTTTGVPTP